MHLERIRITSDGVALWDDKSPGDMNRYMLEYLFSAVAREAKVIEHQRHELLHASDKPRTFKEFITPWVRSLVAAVIGVCLVHAVKWMFFS